MWRCGGILQLHTVQPDPLATPARPYLQDSLSQDGVALHLLLAH